MILSSLLVKQEDLQKYSHLKSNCLYTLSYYVHFVLYACATLEHSFAAKRKLLTYVCLQTSCLF